MVSEHRPVLWKNLTRLKGKERTLERFSRTSKRMRLQLAESGKACRQTTFPEEKKKERTRKGIVPAALSSQEGFGDESSLVATGMVPSASCMW